MNAQLVGTLVTKDLNLFFRNRFFAFISGLGLVFYIGVYFLLPQQVDETLELAIYAPDIPADLLSEMEEDGLEFLDMDSEEALKEAVMTGDIGVGVALPENLVQRINAGELPQTTGYCWRNRNHSARAANRDVRVNAWGIPSSQATIRSMLIAAAVAICCKCVFASPR